MEQISDYTAQPYAKDHVLQPICYISLQFHYLACGDTLGLLTTNTQQHTVRSVDTVLFSW